MELKDYEYLIKSLRLGEYDNNDFIIEGVFYNTDFESAHITISCPKLKSTLTVNVTTDNKTTLRKQFEYISTNLIKFKCKKLAFLYYKNIINLYEKYLDLLEASENLSKSYYINSSIDSKNIEISKEVFDNWASYAWNIEQLEKFKNKENAKLILKHESH